MRIGRRAQAEDPRLGKGKLLDRVKHWSNTKIGVRLKVNNTWEGKHRFIWVEKAGKKSNYKKVEIPAPLL